MDYLELEENIVAVATPPGVGSIDILRLSGLNLTSLYFITIPLYKWSNRA